MLATFHLCFYVGEAMMNIEPAAGHNTRTVTHKLRQTDKDECSLSNCKQQRERAGVEPKQGNTDLREVDSLVLSRRVMSFLVC